MQVYKRRLLFSIKRLSRTAGKKHSLCYLKIRSFFFFNPSWQKHNRLIHLKNSRFSSRFKALPLNLSHFHGNPCTRSICIRYNLVPFFALGDEWEMIEFLSSFLTYTGKLPGLHRRYRFPLFLLDDPSSTFSVFTKIAVGKRFLCHEQFIKRTKTRPPRSGN